VVLGVVLLLAVIALMLAEHDSGATFSGTPIKANTTSGVPSNGHHTGPSDHCNNGHGADANTNKHCISGGSS